jgi:CheY-like chemotaxis protein
MLPTPETTPDEPQKVLQVLVVDDYDDNRDMLRLVLERQGVEVVEASDGIEAVKLAYHCRPDLILMDISMPVMDGLDAVRQLKGVELTRSIPIVVISAHCGDPAVVKRVMDAGCLQCLAKPLELNEIKALIERFKADASPA